MSVNLTNTNEITPLHYCAQFGRLEATKALVEGGAALNAESGSEVNMKLLDKGMSVNLTNTNEIIPLHDCAQFGRLEATKALVEGGAAVNVESGSEVNMMLLDKGMSVNFTNTNEITPLHDCAQFGRLEATKALVEGGAAVNAESGS